MKRFNYGVALALVVALLAGGAWECSSAPKSQCENGSTRVTHHGDKTTRYHCHNNEWVKDR